MIFGLAKTKKNIILLVVLVLSIMTIAVSFAFFAVEVADSVTTNLGATSETVESLTFTQSDEMLSIHATQENFGSGDGNLSATTTSSATLIASESLGSASRTYNAYVNITRNNFLYTQTSNKPELVLTVTKPDGSLLESIDGLTLVTVIDAVTEETVSGFDVTTYEGLIKIQEDIAISTSDSSVGITQDWTITLTFINLVENQYENGGKELVADFILQEETYKYPAVDYILMGYNTLQENPSDTSDMALSANGLIQHTPELANSAGDNNYRYSGSNTLVSNNWVCFGSDEVTCPEGNIYRIIGIYDGSVKLIKKISVGNTSWDAENNNDYETSDIRAYLNNDFYNTIPVDYQLMIKNSIWNVGGNNTPSETAYEFYRDNIGTPIESKISSGKIGLMYVSDYGYAAYKEAWTTDLYNYHENQITLNNWLFNDDFTEHTITITLSSSSQIFKINVGYMGRVVGSDSSGSSDIRPVFYLNTSTKIVDGDGSESNPFRLSM